MLYSSTSWISSGTVPWPCAIKSCKQTSWECVKGFFDSLSVVCISLADKLLTSPWGLSMTPASRIQSSYGVLAQSAVNVSDVLEQLKIIFTCCGRFSGIQDRSRSPINISVSAIRIYTGQFSVANSRHFWKRSVASHLFTGSVHGLSYANVICRARLTRRFAVVSVGLRKRRTMLGFVDLVLSAEFVRLVDNLAMIAARTSELPPCRTDGKPIWPAKVKPVQYDLQRWWSQ